MQDGGYGDDRQVGGWGRDTQEGDEGDDDQEGGDGDDTQDGGSGNDSQLGGFGDDEQDGGAGNDTQIGGVGNDEQNGGDGNDYQSGGWGNDQQVGGDGDDEQDGGGGDDSQFGGAGDDEQIGSAGNDTEEGGPGDDIQDGGFGDDYQWGGPGDDEGTGGEGGDTHFLFFGSSDVVNDEAGTDTLDASGVASSITVDLDLQGLDQVVDTAGNTLQLQGQFEAFVGGPFDDVIFADPLTAPRTLDGGGAQAGDLLNVNAYGLPFTDTGTALIVEGFAPITYTNFATVSVTNEGTDLSIGKSAEPKAIIAGERVTYTFTITSTGLSAGTNAGPTTPVNVTVVDTFSDAGALAGVTSDDDCAWTPGSATVTCTVTDIVSGTPAHLTLGVTSSISASGVLSNTAIVTPTGGVKDVNANNNVAESVEVTIKQAIYLPLILRSSSRSFR
jgi:hypothetical protein